MLQVREGLGAVVLINDGEHRGWNLVLSGDLQEGVRVLDFLLAGRTEIKVLADCALVSQADHLLAACVTVDTVLFLSGVDLALGFLLVSLQVQLLEKFLLDLLHLEANQLVDGFLREKVVLVVRTEIRWLFGINKFLNSLYDSLLAWRSGFFGFFADFADFGERIEAAFELDQATELLQSALNGSRQVVVISDLNGVTAGILVSKSELSSGTEVLPLEHGLGQLQQLLVRLWNDPGPLGGSTDCDFDSNFFHQIFNNDKFIFETELKQNKG